MSAPIFFVHIPKTAGTSFTRAARRALGAEHCQFDYGAGDAHTTPLVQQHCHDTPDFFRFHRRMLREGTRLLAGHVPLQRFAGIVPASRTVSFVRDPVQQVLSHHAHICRHRAPVPLAEFMRGPQGAGMQSRMLSGAPLEALGMVGVTERFDDSLALINQACDFDFRPLSLNLNPEREGEGEGEGGLRHYQIPEGLQADWARLAEADLALHARACALLEARMQARRSGQAFVHGAITSVSSRAVAGFAYVPEEARAVKLALEVDGKPAAEFSALLARRDLVWLGVPRLGFVGFEHRFQRALPAGSRVVIKVLDTGQCLGNAASPAS
jgi:hypothetical protein